MEAMNVKRWFHWDSSDRNNLWRKKGNKKTEYCVIEIDESTVSVNRSFSSSFHPP
jgi:hypothetical protein